MTDPATPGGWGRLKDREFKAQEFGAFVRRLRLSRKLSLMHAAGSVTLSTSVWHAIETGVSKQPAAETLYRIAKALDVEPSYLMAKAGFGDEGDRWRNFTPSERAWMAQGLRVLSDDAITGRVLPEQVRRMQDELEEHGRADAQETER